MKEIFFIRLKETRTKLGLTQKQVSEAANISAASYSAYEQQDGKTPPLDIAYRIADALNVSLDWLTGRENDHTIKTYQELALLLVKLSMGIGLYIGVQEDVEEADALNFLCTLKFVGFTGTNDITPDDLEEKDNFYNQMLNDAKNGTRFVDFLKEWKKIYKLFYLGTIDANLYELWCNKAISELKGDARRSSSLKSGILNTAYDNDVYDGEGLILGGNS